MRLSMARSYGTSVSEVERHGRMLAHMLVLGMALMGASAAFAQAPAAGAGKPIKIVGLGDSLCAGRGLQALPAFAARVKQSLKIEGIDVDMVKAGGSGA